MPKNLLKASLLATTLSLASLAVHAESPPVYPLPIMETAEQFPLVNPAELPFAHESRTDYAVSLAGGKGVLISPNWVLTASHVVTWEHQKNPWKLKVQFKGGKTYKTAKIFRHANKDLALVQLVTPILDNREPVILMRDAIAKNQRITIKKVTEGRASAWKNIPARGGKSKNLIIGKKMRKGGPGTSGSPWLIESPLVGDVVVGITHGGGRAPQVGLAKNWIQSVVDNNTPGELLYWASASQVFAEKPQAMPLSTLEGQSGTTLLALP